LQNLFKVYNRTKKCSAERGSVKERSAGLEREGRRSGKITGETQIKQALHLWSAVRSNRLQEY